MGNTMINELIEMGLLTYERITEEEYEKAILNNADSNIQYVRIAVDDNLSVACGKIDLNDLKIAMQMRQIELLEMLCEQNNSIIGSQIEIEENCDQISSMLRLFYILALISIVITVGFVFLTIVSMISF